MTTTTTILEPPNPYLAAREEWDNLQTVVPTFKNRNPSSKEGNEPPRIKDEFASETPLVTVEAIINHFRTANLEREKELSEIQLKQAKNGSTTTTKFAQSLVCCFFRQWTTERIRTQELEDQKMLILTVAQCLFDNEVEIHFRVLLTIYKQLTGNRFDCLRYGTHWEEIGFQGMDPATDLRGVGFLGLIQPLYLVMTPELFPFAIDLYRLSQSETQNFPLLVLSINVTRIAVIALSDGRLNRLCNEEGNAWSAFNSFYAAVLYRFFHIWKTESKTIKDSGYVLRDVEFYCCNNVKNALEDLEKHLKTAYTIQEKQTARENINKRS